LIAALLFLAGSSLSSAAAQTGRAESGADSADCLRETRLVPSPNPGSANFLKAVAAVPRRGERDDAPGRSAWAVGHYLGQAGVESTLIQRWDGSSWATVSSPNVGTNRNYLNGVAAAGPDDAWAVGFYWDASNIQHIMILRWNGTQWSAVPTPSVGPFESYLNSVTVITPDDVWAVGLYSPDWYAYRTLAMHWDGTQWTVVPTPDQPARDNYLVSVSASGPGDVWAVGHYATDARSDQKTLAMHWDGSSWSIVLSPNVGANRNYLNGVASAGPDTAWAVGFYWDANNTQRTLTMRWNGKAWGVVQSPNASAHENYLNSVAARGREVWAVGQFSPDMLRYRSLMMRWSDGGWQIVPSPNAGARDNYLLGVTFGGRRDVWAAGYSSDTGANPRTMIMRNGCRR
jgi:hypothetical protein